MSEELQTVATEVVAETVEVAETAQEKAPVEKKKFFKQRNIPFPTLAKTAQSKIWTTMLLKLVHLLIALELTAFGARISTILLLEEQLR